MDIDSILNPIHSIIFFISFIGIIVSLIWMITHPRRRGYIIAPLLYFVNVFLYNFVLHISIRYGFNWLSLSQLEIWSGVVRLHSLFLLISYIIIQPARRGYGESQPNINDIKIN